MPGYYQPECWGITSQSAGVLPARVLGYYQPECWGITSRSAGVFSSRSAGVPARVLRCQPEYRLPARVRGVASQSADVSLVGSWSLSSTYCWGMAARVLMFALSAEFPPERWGLLPSDGFYVLALGSASMPG